MSTKIPCFACDAPLPPSPALGWAGLAWPRLAWPRKTTPAASEKWYMSTKIQSFACDAPSGLAWPRLALPGLDKAHLPQAKNGICVECSYTIFRLAVGVGRAGQTRNPAEPLAQAQAQAHAHAHAHAKPQAQAQARAQAQAEAQAGEGGCHNRFFLVLIYNFSLDGRRATKQKLVCWHSYNIHIPFFALRWVWLAQPSPGPGPDPGPGPVPAPAPAPAPGPGPDPRPGTNAPPKRL